MLRVRHALAKPRRVVDAAFAATAIAGCGWVPRERFDDKGLVGRRQPGRVLGHEGTRRGLPRSSRLPRRPGDREGRRAAHDRIRPRGGVRIDTCDRRDRFLERPV